MKQTKMWKNKKQYINNLTLWQYKRNFIHSDNSSKEIFFMTDLLRL